MKISLDRLSIRHQLLWLVAALWVSGTIILSIYQWQSRVTRQTMANYETSVAIQRRIQQASNIYAGDLANVSYQARHGLLDSAKGLQSIQENRARLAGEWTQIRAAWVIPGLRPQLEVAEQAGLEVDAVLERMERAMRSHDTEALGGLAEQDLYPALGQASRQIEILADLQYQDLKQSNLHRQLLLAKLRILLRVMAIICFLGVISLIYLIYRSILKRVETLVDIARMVQKLDFTSSLPPPPGGELGQVALTFAEIRYSVMQHSWDLQRAHDSIWHYEASQKALLDSAQVSIISVGLDGLVTGMNPFAERLLGYAASEVVGKHSPALWHDPLEVEEAARQLCEELGEPSQQWRRVFEIRDQSSLPPREWTYIRKDGSRVGVMLAISKVCDSAGQKIGQMGVATDLTLLKLLERELRLREAEAQEANRAKSEFLATMTHEVRTPLIGILGTLEILSQSSLDQEQRGTIGILRQSANALLRLIGDILDFSKIEAGKLELVPQTVSLQQILDEEIQNLASAAAAKGLRLSQHVDPLVAEAHLADGMRVREIVGNFLSNALKFTQRGSVELHLDLVGEEPGKQILAFRVKDTGIGVAPEHQMSLFQPFVQAESTTTRRFGGTGLGLSISLSLAEMMGGSIRMDSAEGVGTTMTFSAAFPVGQMKDGETTMDLSPLLVSPRIVPTVEEAVQEGSLILLVEDHPTNQLVLCRQLELAGFAVEAASNGEEALDRWESQRYSLILTDINMPGMDGYQLASAIRFHESEHGAQRIPILALTANALQDEAERCRYAGMDDCIIKPVTIPQLVSKLRPWFPDLRWEPVSLSGGPEPLRRDVLGALAADATQEAQIFREFQEATHSDLQALFRALEERDAPGLARQAHRIKGASLLIGAQELAQAAASLEKASQGGDWEASARLAPELEAAFARLRDVVLRKPLVAAAAATSPAAKAAPTG